MVLNLQTQKPPILSAPAEVVAKVVVVDGKDSPPVDPRPPKYPRFQPPGCPHTPKVFLSTPPLPGGKGMDRTSFESL